MARGPDKLVINILGAASVHLIDYTTERPQVGAKYSVENARGTARQIGDGETGTHKKAAD